MSGPWPELDYAASRGTLLTLQRWAQIVGKVRLALSPWLNHSWHVPFYVDARGFGTTGIPFGGELFEVGFDLVEHRLVLTSSAGTGATFPLPGLTVAGFHARFFDALAGIGVVASIDPTPQEMDDPTPFDADDRQAAYEPSLAHAYWRAALQVDRVLKLFRTGFVGKASPVHLFWGAFDLATTRFSGRAAPRHEGMPGLVRVMREAYSHEVSSAGFWPGSDQVPEAAFYSYAYPEPAGFRAAPVPEGAIYSAEIGEFVLPYHLVRSAPDPERRLLDFLEATYAAAADAGGWDRSALEAPTGRLGRPRAV